MKTYITNALLHSIHDQHIHDYHFALLPTINKCTR